MACARVVDVDDDNNNNQFSPMVKLHDDDDDDSSIHADKLSYEIFSILESKFLFGYDDPLPEPQNGDVSDARARGKICVLTVDGGGCGLRSFHSGKTLSYLETALKNESGNPDARIADYFDVAAGTGVGGIFTAMLFASDDRGRPIFHAEDTWKFLAAEAEKFSAPAKGAGFLKRLLNRIPAAGREKVMKEAFKDERTGRSLTLKDTLKPILIPCYDLSTRAPFLFSRADAVETDSYDFNLWEVCLATSAQPDVFGPVHMKSVDGSTRCVGVDGGLAMSNPTAAAITHVLHNKQEFPFVRGVEDILVLSVGLGGQLLEGSYDFDRIKKWTARDWARPLALISCESSAELVDHAMAMSFGLSHTSNYVRIQANGPRLEWGGSNVNMDASPSNVKTLMERADEMLKQKNVESVMFNGKRIGEESNMEKLDWFAAQLVLEHQSRNCRTAPTVAFKQPAAPNPSHSH